MRYLIILLAALSLASCKDLDIKKVEYHTSTMMGKTILSVTQDSVIVTFNGRGEPTYFAREAKDAEWTAVLKSIMDVDLDKIADLEAPSNRRANDVVGYAKFIVVGRDKSHISGSFDAKNPNAVLMPLMEEINKIEEENKK